MVWSNYSRTSQLEVLKKDWLAKEVGYANTIRAFTVLKSAPSTGPRFFWIGWCSLDFQWRGERCCRDRNWRYSKRNLQLKLMFFFSRDLKRAQIGKSEERKKTSPVQKTRTRSGQNLKMHSAPAIWRAFTARSVTTYLLPFLIYANQFSITTWMQIPRHSINLTLLYEIQGSLNQCST